jgi:hypothetical protein
MDLLLWLSHSSVLLPPSRGYGKKVEEYGGARILHPTAVPAGRLEDWEARFVIYIAFLQIIAIFSTVHLVFHLLLPTIPAGWVDVNYINPSSTSMGILSLQGADL